MMLNEILQFMSVISNLLGQWVGNYPQEGLANLATGQRGTENNLGFLLCSGYIFEPIV